MCDLKLQWDWYIYCVEISCQVTTSEDWEPQCMCIDEQEVCMEIDISFICFETPRFTVNETNK
jgi:hypothetical protein